MLPAAIRPSAAARIEVCPGSREKELMHPQEDTIEKREGVASHWAGQRFLSGDVTFVGEVADNGVTLNEDMIAGARMWANHIMSRGPVGDVEKVTASGALHPDNWGTPDHAVWVSEIMTLFIDDYKYGRKWVPVFMNRQCVNYALLKAKELNLPPHAKVVITIVQPRTYHRDGPIRTWETTVGDLQEPGRKLAAAFTLSMQPNAPISAADVDQCEDCSARMYCEAFLGEVYRSVDYGYNPAPLVMSPLAKAKHRKLLMRAEKFIKSAREGLDEDIKSTLRLRSNVPGFTMGGKKGRLGWKEGAEEDVILIAQSLGIKVTKDRVLVTPTQAITAGIPAELVAEYSYAPTVYELIEEDGTLAAKLFGGK